MEIKSISNPQFDLQIVHSKQKNIYTQINELVRDILQMCLKTSDLDRSRSDALKDKFHLLSDQAASAIKSKANLQLFFSGISLAVPFATLKMNDNMQKTAGVLSQHIPQLGNWTTVGSEIRQMKATAEQSLIQQELSSLQNSNTREIQSQVLQVLEALKGWVRSSTQG